MSKEILFNVQGKKLSEGYDKIGGIIHVKVGNNDYNCLMQVEKDGLFGAINLKGEIVIPIEHLKISLKGNYGYKDNSLEKILLKSTDLIMVAKRRGKDSLDWGAYNSSGVLVIDIKYDDIIHRGKSLVIVQK